MRIAFAGGAVAIMILGALCEARLRDDPMAAIYVLGMIGACLAVVGLGGMAPTSAARQERTKQAERGRNVDEVLRRITRLVREHVADAAGYSDRLRGANQKLSQLAASEPIDEIVLSLIKNNQDMQGKVLTLSDKLDESRTQIIQLQSSLAKAEEFGLKDSLTGIGNRRFFDSSLADEVALALSHGHELCLFIADLDHFKRINDGFGHVVGDTLLKIFAELLTSNLKGQDRVARYGGEEFAVLFPRTRLNDAVSVAEQIRRQLEAKQWVIGRSGERVGTLTASFGLARLGPGESGPSLVQRADAMLYRAKARGRNRVEADEPNVAIADAPSEPRRPPSARCVG
jgi:diguanylate cyclase